MVLSLSLALALAAFAAAVGWVRWHEERSRAQRLADEVAALRKASSGQRLLDSETGSTPALPHYTTVPEAGEVQAEVEKTRITEVRRRLSRAAEVLSAAESRPRSGSALPIESIRQEAVDLLTGLERLEITFAALPERGARLAGEVAHRTLETVPPPPAPFDTTAFARGVRGAEDLSDTSGRLKDSLSGLVRSTDRLREATVASSEALAAVARGAEAIAPMAGALSAVANRVNLLALNLAVLVSPGAAGANIEEAGSELRSIFEEARRLSREVGAQAQRVASAARGATERSAELATAITEERGRVERGAVSVSALDELAERLQAAFESVRGAARENDDQAARLHARLSASVAQAEAFAADLESERKAAAGFASELLAAVASITETRIAAERTVRNLLAIAETVGDRRPAQPDPAALEAVRESLDLLS